MDYTQNAKISQVSEQTLILGVDVESEVHYARAFNWRGIELSKKPFRFTSRPRSWTTTVRARMTARTPKPSHSSSRTADM